MRYLKALVLFQYAWLLAFVSSAATQPPEPGPAKPTSIPAVREKALPNGLVVAVAERDALPIVSVEIIVKRGAGAEPSDRAGLAEMTASLLTKGTKKRTAEQISQEIEFLGGRISSAASWDRSTVTLNVTSDKLDQAMEIFSDVVLNPTFTDEEVELLRTQTIDGLTYGLTEPSFLGEFVASKLTFGEHPSGGTPQSIKAITASDVRSFHRTHFTPANAVLLFTGDINEGRALQIARKRFGGWSGEAPTIPAAQRKTETGAGLPARIIVVDLPNSGQAAVSYYHRLSGVSRTDEAYYAASVLNSLLGGGYSARLNQEIRIKRGLSYGASSGFDWRTSAANFSASAQTKNESAPEVVELILAELKRLQNSSANNEELNPRKAVLTGEFARRLETTTGLTGALAALYSFGLPTSALNDYVTKVTAISAADLRTLSARLFTAGDIVVVGDYSKFKDGLQKRFPGLTPRVIKANEVPAVVQ